MGRLEINNIESLKVDYGHWREARKWKRRSSK